MTTTREEFASRLGNLTDMGVSQALSLGLQPADAADVVQDALATAWVKIDTFEGASSLTTWLYRIVRNRALTFLKTRRRRRDFDLTMVLDDIGGYDATPDSCDDPEHVLSSTHAIYELARLIDEARPTIRQTLMAKLLTNGTRQKMGQAMGLTSEQVGNRVKNLKNWAQANRSTSDPFSDNEHPFGKLRPIIESTLIELRNLRLAEKRGASFSSTLNFSQEWKSLAARIALQLDSSKQAICLAVDSMEHDMFNDNAAYFGDSRLTLVEFMKSRKPDLPDTHWLPTFFRARFEINYGELRIQGGGTGASVFFAKGWRLLSQTCVSHFQGA